MEHKFPHLVGYCHVSDVGKAAKDWPQLNFIIYHSGYRGAAGGTVEMAYEQLNSSGCVEWVSDLADIPHSSESKTFMVTSDRFSPRALWPIRASALS